jgi:hypothetical protein
MPEMGHHFITAHWDLPGVGGVIAIVNLEGVARFRVWPDEGEANEWQTAPGDLVLLRGRDWPSEGALCPRHEAEPPPTGGRSILTYRFNRGGPGADYFS